MADLVTIWRDEALVIVDKPAGLPTQAPRGGGDNLYDRLRDVTDYAGLHHRLDAAASGLVLFTLDRAANAAIARGFREHRIVRRYRAVLVGHVEGGAWDRPLGDRTARTDVAVIGHANGMTAVELSLHTGRTHQIRRHAALAGRPVAGDRHYGGEAGRAWPRLALHAAHLELDHPLTGEPLVLDSPLPDDLAELWRLAGGA